jgi:hypothetical protein
MMLESYRIDAPSIPPITYDPHIERALDFPAPLPDNARQITRNYFLFLLPITSVIGFVLISIVSEFDYCWIVLVPLAIIQFWGRPHLLLGLVITCIGGLIVGQDVVNYVLPMLMVTDVSRSFARHYLWVCTGVPLPADEAEQIRCSRHWKPDRSKHRDRVAAVRDAFDNWFAYNVDCAAGSLETPAGSIERRVMHTVFATIALCVLCVRPWQDSPSRSHPAHQMSSAMTSGISDPAEKERASSAAAVITIGVLILPAPTFLLIWALSNLYLTTLLVAHNARIRAISQPVESQFEAILDRLDRHEEPEK